MHLFAKRIFDMLHLIATPNQIAQLLAASRRQAGLTQAEAAARVGVSQSRISTWETDAAALTVAQLLALCGAYGLQLQMRDKNKPEFEPAPLIEW
jgi:HTH-type transcriptional regulator/antitoxin HipB